MGLIKKLLFLIFLILCIAAGLYVARNYIPADKLPFQNLGLTNLQPTIQESIGSAGKSLSQIPQLGQILGAKDAVLASPLPSGEGTNSTSGPQSPTNSLPERAFEFGRYSYCHEVVKDYEARYGKQ